VRNTVIATAAMSLIAAGVYALSGSAADVHIGYLLLSVVAAVLVYAVCLVLLGELDAQELAAIKQRWSRVVSRLGIASL